MSAAPISLLCSVFDDPSAWQIVASGQARGQLTSITGPDHHPGLRLAYDFHGGGGFVVIRHVVPLQMPDTFEIGWQVRGDGPSNNLEFKVTSQGGTDVWRHLRQAWQPPKSWCPLRLTERDLLFAWGPAGGGPPTAVEAIEFVIAAGTGGAGSLDLAAFCLTDQTARAPHAITASSSLTGTSPAAVFGAQGPREWCAAADDPAPWWAIDFGRPQRFGGIIIDWPEPMPPRDLAVEQSTDGQAWTRVFHAPTTNGPRSYIPLPAAETRHLRLTFATPGSARLLAVRFQPDAFSRTPNEFMHAVAADFPRGWFPRYWLREQSYWTPVGSPAGKRRALINEEGMVEVDEAGFSLEPFVLTTQRQLTWADVKTTASLPVGGAPMPAVAWLADGVRLDIRPWVDGRDDNLTLHVTYRLRCRDHAARLVVAVRPFQVNPPWQAFRNLGGQSPIHRLASSQTGLTVNDRQLVVTPQADASGVAAFEEGGLAPVLAQGQMPARNELIDASGWASAALAWEIPATHRGLLEVTVSVPFFNSLRMPTRTSRASALARWRKTLGRVTWSTPACAAKAIDCFRTAAGHILIHRDGPAIQPGPRRYTRSWIRDCVIMGAALAKAGIPAPLREFITWYARFQRRDGFVPCVVDRDGVDWLVEHDSHGQFLWAIREVFRQTGDQNFLRQLWPHLQSAVSYLIEQRRQRLTPGTAAACRGLLPESASHEGYLAHPVHSYWDDFWGVRGLEAAAELATACDLTDQASQWRNEAVAFQHDLLRSITTVIADRQLAYLPGSVEWADFDPTATANAIAQLDFADVLPAVPLREMLATYLDGFRRKHSGEMPWTNYTAYEIRIIGALVRTGQREQAHELLEFFLTDQRPPAWNQWPEITWRDARAPGHLGDVPHTWIAAEYLLALAAMVASEREASDALVLAAGLPWQWVATAPGFTVRGLPTRFGALDFTITAPTSTAIEVQIGGSLTMPPGGLTLAPPLPPGTRIVTVIDRQSNRNAVAAPGTSITITCLPFHATLELAT